MTMTIKRLAGSVINAMLKNIGYKVTRDVTLAFEIRQGKYRWLQDKNIATVLDIGANIGQFASSIRTILPDSNIYSFEPLKSCYTTLLQQSNTIGNMECFNYALGDTDGESKIFHNTFEASSSLMSMNQLHKTAFPQTANVVEETIRVQRLDSVFKSLAIERPLLVKIDVQGYELNVLRGAKQSLPYFDVCIVETSFQELYTAQPLFDDLYNFFIKNGFNYHGNFDQIINPVNGEVLQADAIFIRAE